MAALVPAFLTEYLALFRTHFTKPSFSYFSGYVVSLFLTSGRKTMSRVAHTCFFVERHLASWERFLAEYQWDLNAVLARVVQCLIAQLGGGKGKVTRHYFLQGLKQLLVYKQVEQKTFETMMDFVT